MSHNPRFSLATIINGTTTTASYTLDDNLIVYGDNTYSYNDDGYLQTKTTPDGTTTYSYGTMGELLSVTTPAKTVSYKHNALNQRVAKLVDGEVVEKYLWADLTTLLAVYDADDTLVQRFEYADQRMPIAMTDKDGNRYYLHYDQVGSLRAVSRVLSPDNTTKLIKEITYDTYGNILSDTNSSFKIPFGFAGGLYDPDTKLTRFGYRDFDAYTGKWTAKDPIGFAGGDSNLYGYVLGDPAGFIDSNGLARGKNGGDGSLSGRGTNNPYKHCREISATQIECKSKKDGKRKIKPKPADWDKYKKIDNCHYDNHPDYTFPKIEPEPWWYVLPFLIPFIGPMLAL